MANPFIKTVDLCKYFHTKKGELHAVDHVNLEVEKGQTLGIVGESGCGKSTLGRVIMGLLPATGGEIYFDGKEISKLSPRERKPYYQKMQMVFQDPYASLNPRMTVGQLIMESLIVNRPDLSRDQMLQKVLETMDTVGLARRFFHTYPHELDGGRRQRIGIARALVLNPEFIVCDEPVSALDVSIQAQILNLMMDLQDEMGLTYLFITHNLAVVKHISNSIAVMYLGQCVEHVSSEELFRNPLHPYTQALLRAIPVADLSSRGRKREIIKGELSSPINPGVGCRFAPRCPYATPECTSQSIPLREVSPGHFVACCAVQQSGGKE